MGSNILDAPAIMVPSFRDAARLMFPAGFKHRLLAVLTAYIDESGTHDGSPIFALAGCVSDSKGWEAFDRRWRKFLAHYELETFHMNKFENRIRPYDNWTDRQRRKALARALDITSQTVLFCFGSALVRKDFNALSDGDKALLGNEYLICANHCAQIIANWQKKTGRDEFVAHVYDTTTGAHMMREVAANTLNNDMLRKKFQLLSITFSRAREFAALQAADLVAYEVAKQAARRVNLVNRPSRFPFMQLSARVEFKGQFLDAETLEKLLVERRAGIVK